MPSLSLVGGNKEFTWQITGLSSPFNSSYYVLAGVTINQFTQKSDHITGSVDEVSTDSSRTSNSTPTRTVSWSSADTITLYGYNLALNGTYYPCGSATVVITDGGGGGGGATRPDNWAWSNIWSGAPLSNLTWTEWNGFCDRINQFRVYKGGTSYPFTRASGSVHLVPSGSATGLTLRTAVNQAISAIGGISGHGYLPSQVTADTKITYSIFSTMASALNAVY